MRIPLRAITIITLVTLHFSAYCQQGFIISPDHIDFGIINYDTVKTNTYSNYLEENHLSESFNNHYYDRTSPINIFVKNISTKDLYIFKCSPPFSDRSLDISYTKDPIHPGDSGRITIVCKSRKQEFYRSKFFIMTSEGDATVNIQGRFVPMPHLLELNTYDIDIKGKMRNRRIIDGIDTSISLSLHNLSDEEPIEIDNIFAEPPFYINEKSFTLSPGEKKFINVNIHPFIPSDNEHYFYSCAPEIHLHAGSSYNENIVITSSLTIYRQRDTIIKQANPGLGYRSAVSVLRIPSSCYPSASFFVGTSFYYIYPAPSALKVITSTGFEARRLKITQDTLFFDIDSRSYYSEEQEYLEAFFESEDSIITTIIDTSKNIVLERIAQRFEVLPALALSYQLYDEGDSSTIMRFCLRWKLEHGQFVSVPLKGHFNGFLTDTEGNSIPVLRYSDVDSTGYFDGWYDCGNCTCRSLHIRNSDNDSLFHAIVEEVQYRVHAVPVQNIYEQRNLYPKIGPVYVYIVPKDK